MRIVYITAPGLVSRQARAYPYLTRSADTVSYSSRCDCPGCKDQPELLAVDTDTMNSALLCRRDALHAREVLKDKDRSESAYRLSHGRVNWDGRSGGLHPTVEEAIRAEFMRKGVAL